MGYLAERERRVTRNNAIGTAIRSGMLHLHREGWYGSALIVLSGDGAWGVGEITRGCQLRYVRGRLVRNRPAPRCIRRYMFAGQEAEGAAGEEG